MPARSDMELQRPAIKQTKKGLEIRVRVAPNSSQESVCFDKEQGLIVKLKSPPVDGRANRDLLRIVAKKLGIAPTRIAVCKGLASRNKVLLVQEFSDADAMDKLSPD